MAAPPTKIQQISLPELTINYNFKEVPRYDRCTTCHQGIDRLGYDKDAERQADARGLRRPPVPDHGGDLDRSQGARSSPPASTSTPTARTRSTASAARSATAARARGPTSRSPRTRPTNLEEEEHWKKEYGWQEIHHWDYPMLPERFIESSCVKCHHQVTDIPQAKKLQAGYQRIVQYGCTGCHTIGGEGSFGPDLTDERHGRPEPRATSARRSPRSGSSSGSRTRTRSGPTPGCRGSTALTNNDAKDDLPKSDAEIQAITHYLFARARPPPTSSIRPPRPTPSGARSSSSRRAAWPATSTGPTTPRWSSRPTGRTSTPTTSPTRPRPTTQEFPESVRTYAQADYGPNLGNLAAKFQSEPDKGLKWLSNWIQNPEKYHPKSLMPNLQLPLQDAADIASWLISVPGDWPVKVAVAPVAGQGGCRRPRRAGQALRHQGGIQDAGRQVGRGAPERGRRVRRQAQHRRQALLPGREDDRAAGLLRLPHRSRDSRTPSRSAPRSTTGASRARRSSITATSRNTWKTRSRRTTATATAPTRSTRSRSSTRPGSASSTRSCTGRGATTT